MYTLSGWLLHLELHKLMKNIELESLALRLIAVEIGVLSIPKSVDVREYMTFSHFSLIVSITKKTTHLFVIFEP